LKNGLSGRKGLKNGLFKSAPSHLKTLDYFLEDA
jgi:hypothetical protein